MDDSIDLSNACDHVTSAMRQERIARPTSGCATCLAHGMRWVHLRVCLTCGHIGCCDQSPGKHATKHFHTTQHPVIASGEVGENWAYCYPDDQFLSGE